MIPKTIHYCWFGKEKKPDIFYQCLVSWEKYCPDFEIKEWNENNTKSYQNKFYKNAYRKKKYAFVADCVRVQTLLEYGGVYLDIDMLLIKPIDDLLYSDFIVGEEVTGRVNFALFGAVQGQNFLKKMKKFYDTTPFNEFSVPVITHTFSPLVQTENLTENERIFPPEYFYALPYQNRNEDHSKYVTENSYAVHLWDHSWNAEKNENTSTLVRNLRTVTADYVFYGYPRPYFIRYFREFSRKLYHRMIGKKMK
jgi:mannosyltransferase OCH1-like enzyme